MLSSFIDLDKTSEYHVGLSRKWTINWSDIYANQFYINIYISSVIATTTKGNLF